MSYLSKFTYIRSSNNYNASVFIQFYLIYSSKTSNFLSKLHKNYKKAQWRSANFPKVTEKHIFFMIILCFNYVYCVYMLPCIPMLVKYLNKTKKLIFYIFLRWSADFVQFRTTDQDFSSTTQRFIIRMKFRFQRCIGRCFFRLHQNAHFVYP